MKKCNICNTEKPFSEFSKSKAKEDGLQNKCKECNKQYRLDNKDTIKYLKKNIIKIIKNM